MFEPWKKERTPHSDLTDPLPGVQSRQHASNPEYFKVNNSQPPENQTRRQGVPSQILTPISYLLDSLRCHRRNTHYHTHSSIQQQLSQSSRSSTTPHPLIAPVRVVPDKAIPPSPHRIHPRGVDVDEGAVGGGPPVQGLRRRRRAAAGVQRRHGQGWRR